MAYSAKCFLVLVWFGLGRHVCAQSTVAVTTTTTTKQATTTQIPALTTERPPSSVVDLRVVSSGPDSLDVSWEDSSGADTYSVSYQLTDEYQCGSLSSSSNTTVDGVTETTYTLADLKPYSTYMVYVRAFNSKGVGTDAAAASETTAMGRLPVTVSSLEVGDPTHHELNVSWSLVPSATGIPACVMYNIEYRLIYRGQCLEVTDDAFSNQNTNDKEIVIGDLYPYSTYEFKVSAATDDLVGEVSMTMTRMTLESAPTAYPPNLTVSDITPTTSTFKWDELPCDERNGLIIAYELILTDDMDNLISGITPTFLPRIKTFTSLIPFTNYVFRVRALTMRGQGPYTDPIQVTTLKSAPPQPSNLTFIGATTTSVEFQWSPPPHPNGILDSYLLQYNVIEHPFNAEFNPSESARTKNEKVLHTNNTRTFTYEYDSQLQEGMTIRVFIRAVNDVDTGQAATMNLSTVVKDPTIEFPELKLKRNGDDSLRVSPSSPITYYRHVSKYLLVVNTGNDEVASSLLSDYASSTTSYYIAAAFDTFPSDGFTIGDNSTNNGYYNPTVKGEDEGDVEAHLGYMFEIIQGKFIFISGGVRLDDTPSILPIVAGVSAAGAVVLLLLAILLVAWKCGGWKRKKDDSYRPPLSQRWPNSNAGLDFELNDKKTSLIPGINIPMLPVDKQLVAKGRYVNPEDEQIYDFPQQPAKPPTSAVTLDRRLVATLPRHRKRGMVPWSYFDLSSESLGHGAFGDVYLGYVWSENLNEWKPAAIKVLKANAPAQEQTTFKDEVKMMQKIGYHRNVISLLAASTDDKGILHVGIQLAPHGNLRRYLRRYRKARKRDADRSRQSRTSSDGNEEAIPELTIKQLLTFALHVAEGMRHLVKKKVIHRDLAARNVLLADDDDNIIAKVADFGLARDETYELSTRKSRVATRWLAMESLAHNRYSHKTDVWAFGVLVWEILTLGSTPYQDLDKREVYRYLQEGYRLPQPEGCNNEIYQLMQKCWQEEPEHRPSFDELKMQLHGIMERKEEEDHYMNWTPQIPSIREDRDDN